MNSELLESLKSIAEGIGTALSPLPKIWRDSDPDRYWVAYSNGSVDSYVTYPQAEKYCQKNKCTIIESYKIMKFNIKKK